MSRPLHETDPGPPRAFLVEFQGDDTELRGLVKTLGLAVVGAVTIRQKKEPRYGMGSGKAAEIAQAAEAAGAECIVFDGELPPSQQRNWEALSGLAALDRQELIIRIFAAGARTREAELQAELAALVYSLPRLSHKYVDLSRQRGGHYGTRGSGETKLETDRRRVEERIHRLREEIAKVRRQRGVQRRRREKQGLLVCALVGYTNAGKSSLLNALTGAGLLVEDKLFATLDATARRLETFFKKDKKNIVLIDTVGFIRRLPHALVDAFRSTLEEAARSDLLLHVLDASDPEMEAQFETTRTVLTELGAGETPSLLLLNKIDRLDPQSRAALSARYPDAIAVSALDRTGLDALLARLEAWAAGE